MKLIRYIFFLTLVISCKNMSRSDNEPVYEAKEMSVDLIESFKYENILKEKLQDYYDLLSLKKNYPHFKAEINRQLLEIANDTSTYDINKGVVIQQINKKGEPYYVNDSTIIQNLEFNIVSNGLSKKDSIKAIIHANKVLIDGQLDQSIKIKFLKN